MCAPSCQTVRLHSLHTCFRTTFDNLVHTDNTVLHFVITFIKGTPKVWTKYDLHTLDTLFIILYTLLAYFSEPFTHFPQPCTHWYSQFCTFLSPLLKVRPKWRQSMIYTLWTHFSTYFTHFFDQNISSMPKVCNKICKRSNHATTPRHHVSSMLPGSGLWAELPPIFHLDTSGYISKWATRKV